MTGFGRSIERTVFCAVEEFLRAPKVLEHRSLRPPTPGIDSSVRDSVGHNTRLFAIYGDRLRISGTGPAVEQHLRDLESLPDGFHKELAEHFSGHPKGGIDIVDGPVTDVMTELRGKWPPGWSADKTFDDVRAIYDSSTRRVVLGGRGEGSSCCLAVHETAHAFDDARGGISSSAKFKELYDKMGRMGGYYHQPVKYGRQEVFAEGLAAWSKNRHESEWMRHHAIGEALVVRSNKPAKGALLDAYYSDLLSSLE